MGSESVKGSLLVGAVVSVRRLRDRGVLPVEAIEARLPAEAIELLDAKIEIARWYPVSAFCDLLDLDWEVSGRREPGYLERQGAVSADRMFDSKMYQQLDFAERAGKVSNRRGLTRQSKLITTITGTFYNFLTFDVALDADRLVVSYGNAKAFREPLLHTTVGFMDQINARQGSSRRWAGERVREDLVRFTMTLPERFGADD